jgi:hypothetical protein
MSEEKIDALLEKVDAEKRATLKRLILGTIFAIPVIASFPMDGLTINSALAADSNTTLHLTHS